MDVIRYIKDCKNVEITAIPDEENSSITVMTEIIKRLHTAGKSLFEIQYFFSVYQHDTESTVYHGFHQYVVEIFEAKQFHKFNLKSTTEEEAAIELLKQTKPKDNYIRKALMVFIKPTRLDLYREYKKLAHLFDWEEIIEEWLSAGLVTQEDIIMDDSYLQKYALFFETFKDYIPVSTVANHLENISVTSTLSIVNK
jgi:hypothetical protein